jgi:D-amino-acid dehydrogenase
MKKVIIIGGGIIGQFCAYYLSKAGQEVTVIDDHPKMSPASEGNCGLVTPSHIIPLNSFNAILQGIKWLGKKDAPLKIKPQLNRKFLLWFLNFMRYSQSASIKKAMFVRHNLLEKSFNLYESFFKEESNQSEWKKDGLLYVCKKEKSLTQFEQEIDLHKKYNMKSRMLTREEVHELEPLLKEGLVGGAMMEMDGSLNPNQLLKDLRKINENAGVQYINGKVEDFVVKSAGIESIKTETETYQGDEFVLAAGALTPILSKKLNISIPIIPGKGYNLTTKNGQAVPLNQPVYMVEKKVVATPWETGFRIGSTMEFAGYNLDLNESRLNALKIAASEYLDFNIDSLEMQPWAGWRPMKDNGIPIIERSEIRNLTIATGHSMVGLSMAPATGYIVNELISANDG